MRKNDFFKYLLFRGGNPASRAELETETLPYTFNSNSYKLRNYRIYGNTVNEESVGDLVTGGDHDGEYLVPVRVEGKNLLQNMATSQTVNGVTFTINENGSINCDGSARDVIIKSLNSTVTLLPNTGYILSGCIGGTSSTSYRIDLRTSDKAIIKDVNGSEIRCYNGEFAFMVDEIVIATPYIRIASGYNCENVEISPMIRLSSIDDSTYEPYHAPVTISCYLTEQLKMAENEADYIDYTQQKRYNADGTSEYITLPTLPTFPDINTLSVGTTVQPSKVYLQGKIAEVETVSAELIQANIQSLQPLSLDDEDLELDVMPTDNSLQPDVMPIEKPVLNLNDVSKIENAEIERGVESAE